MGNMVEASCGCGYTSDLLLEGCGMLGSESCRDLARCDHCREVVSIRATSTRRRCPRCRRKVVVLRSPDDSDDERRPELPTTGEECPRCHRPTMRLEMAGLWD